MLHQPQPTSATAYMSHGESLILIFISFTFYIYTADSDDTITRLASVHSQYRTHQLVQIKT